MGRNRRAWNPEVFEHVVMRGNNRQSIFRDTRDFQTFFHVMNYTYQKYPFTIISYCLMTNHYHLLIRSPEVPLGKVMAMINRRYSDYHKKKYGYFGTMYEGRYFSDKVVTATSLLTASRYIHRNPINTKIPMVEEMEQYPYSSFHLYVAGRPAFYDFFDLDFLLKQLPPPYPQTFDGYLTYCRKPEPHAEDEA
ncbi:transposase [Planococcus sp. FY231025]|uniref:transposase n=1 Tax=Planococcus sp. FY231025 TaxID=3455699 RepID=UPI003F92D5A8